MRNFRIFSLFVFLGVAWVVCITISLAKIRRAYPRQAVSIIPVLKTQAAVLKRYPNGPATATPTSGSTEAASIPQELTPTSQLPTPLPGLEGIHAVSYDPDGWSVYLVTAQGLVRERDGVQEFVYTWPEAIAEPLAVFSGDGARLAARLNQGDVVLVETASASASQTFQTGEWPTALSLRPDGSWLAAAVGEDSVRVWKTGTGELLFDFTPALGGGVVYQSLAFSPDGGTLAGGFMNFVDMWEPGSGGKTRIEPGCRSEQVFDLAFSPDGNELAIVCGPGGEPPIGSLFVWDLAGGRAILAREEIPQVHHLAYSPDGKWLATGGPDGVVRVWEASGAGEPCAFREQAAPITALVFSPDGKILARASEDGLAYLKLEDWLQSP